jgi:polyvinyl alcohol dehydrogenase (cytochrome)
LGRHGSLSPYVLALVAVLALTSAPPAAAQTARGTALTVAVRTPSQPQALDAGRLTVALRARRTVRVRLGAAVAQGRRTRPIVRGVRVRVRGGRPRVVRLRLTRSGRSLLRRGCRTIRVTARAGSRRITRRLAPEAARCGRRSDGPAAPVAGGDGPRAGNPAEPLAAPGDWPMWGFDVRGSRHNPHESALTPQSVGKLEVKWAFAFPDTDQAASSQPAVVGDTLYVGARNGRFYALDARTGAQRWVFDTREVVRPRGERNLLRNGPVVKDGVVYFGDFEGYMYALDAATGKLRWATEVDTHRFAIITGSPLLYDGRLYIGVSSEEVFAAGSPDYPCCQFRGSLVALDAKTGRMVWKHHTVPPPVGTGTNANGARTFGPNGGSVWSTPSADPETDTVYFGTGPNYLGAPAGETDSVVAADADTGATRWVMQATKGDRWNAACLFSGGSPNGNCPEPGPDYDFGSSPNIFSLGGRTVVGAGQKSGVYHLMDARTGDVLWRTQLSKAPGTGGAGGQNGIQWGTAFDGQRIYAATNQGVPEPVLAALEPGSGKVLWSTPAPEDGCRTGGAVLAEPGSCTRAYPAAVTATPGVVFTGARDGKMRAFDSASGKVLWSYDTARPEGFMGVNGVPGRGGSISHGGATVARGMLYTNSGYLTSNAPFTGMRGNVLLAFGLPGEGGTR